METVFQRATAPSLFLALSTCFVALPGLAYLFGLVALLLLVSGLGHAYRWYR